MALRGGVVVPISADTSGLTRGLNKGQSGLRKFGKMAGLVAGAAVLGGLIKTIQIGTKKFIEQDDAIKQTNARLKSTGGVANVTAASVVKLSDAIASKTGIDDDQIHSAENMLLTFTNLRNEVGKGNDIFNQATQVAADLSIAFKKDLQGSAILVGKALNDPVKGLSALSRVGVQFTEGQKKAIKALVETGDIMGAQKLIIKELNTQVGGAAAAFGQTLPGQLSILKQAFDEVALGLAVKFIPWVMRAFKSLTGFISELGKQPTFKAKIEFIIGKLKDAAGNLYDNLRVWWTEQKRLSGPTTVEIKVELSRSERVDAWFASLGGKGGPSGKEAGKRFSDFFFSKEGGGNFGTRMSAWWANATDNVFINAYVGVTSFAVEWVAAFVTQMGKSIYANRGRIWEFIKDAFTFKKEDLFTLGKTLVGGVTAAFRSSKPKEVIKTLLTTAVRDAVQSARSSLEGMGSSLGGMLATITGTSSPEAKRLAAIRKAQKAENNVREKARLQNAIDSAETDDELTQAKRDMADFVLESEAAMLEESIALNQSANQQKIADLIESFNQGTIDATQFSADLNAIIGEDRGGELGIAFAGAFGRELKALEGTAADIATVIANTLGGGQIPQTAGVNTGATAGLKAENKRRFEEAVARWEKARDAVRTRGETAAKRPGSPGGATITDAEEASIKARVLAWVGANKRPKREAFGLALGGILNKQVFTAGESGREAVIPLDSARGTKILQDAIGGGGRGGSNTVYNLVVNAGLGTNPDELSRIIVESIRRFEKRNGQVFSGPLLSTTVNTAGKTNTGVAATDFSRVTTLRSK